MNQRSDNMEINFEYLQIQKRMIQAVRAKKKKK